MRSAAASKPFQRWPSIVTLDIRRTALQAYPDLADVPLFSPLESVDVPSVGRALGVATGTGGLGIVELHLRPMLVLKAAAASEWCDVKGLFGGAYKPAGEAAGHGDDPSHTFHRGFERAWAFSTRLKPHEAILRNFTQPGTSQSRPDSPRFRAPVRTAPGRSHRWSGTAGSADLCVTASLRA